MYRVDIRDGSLVIRFNGGDPLVWDDDMNFIQDREGTPYKKEFDVEIEGKRVWGWDWSTLRRCPNKSWVRPDSPRPSHQGAA